MFDDCPSSASDNGPRNRVRLACVDVPAFPLQLLLRERPDWAGWPAAVVDADKPTGLLLWANGPARDAGVLPGLRYAAALALAPELRAAPVPPEAITAGVEALTDQLRAFSPHVEPSREEPGVFWLDAGGFERLYPSPRAWAEALRADLAAHGLEAAVVAGFGRFGTYAAAKHLRGRKAAVLASPAREAAIAARVPLALVGLPPPVRDVLHQLGIERVGEFAALPADGVRRRFGPEALALHRFASGTHDLPLSPVPPRVPAEARLQLDYREENAQRLVFTVKPLVDELLAELARRGQALSELRLHLALEDRPEHTEAIRTAEATLAGGVVMELVRLRLDAAPLPAPVLGLRVTAEAVPATREQLRMFSDGPKRDPRAAARAFARLRAAFARDDVVVRAELRDRHLPELSFAWEPLHALPTAQPDPLGVPTLVRQLWARPETLPPATPHGPDGWLLAGPARGPLTHLDGPYRLTGAWWRREIQRDYHFAELHRGDLLWVYHDAARGRWLAQGDVT